MTHSPACTSATGRPAADSTNAESPPGPTTRREYDSHTTIAGTKRATPRKAMSPAEPLASPRTPGTYRAARASGPPVAATVRPTNSTGGTGARPVLAGAASETATMAASASGRRHAHPPPPPLDFEADGE